MKTVFVTLGIVLVMAVMATFHRHSRIEELRDRNTRLRTASEEAEVLDDKVAHLRSIEIDTNALEALRGETLELMRLRDKVSQLRPIADKPDTELQREVEHSQTALETANASFDREAEWIVERVNARRKEGIALLLCKNLEDYTTRNGVFPGTLEDFRGSVSQSLNQPGLADSMTNHLPAEYIAQIDARVEHFELLTPRQDFAITKAGSLILRERTPRKLTNGEWERVYAHRLTTRQAERYARMYARRTNRPGDPPRFEVTTARPEDGDFERWELEFATLNQ